MALVQLVALSRNGTATNNILIDNTGSDYDLMADSPTQNYATLNPLKNHLLPIPTTTPELTRRRTYLLIKPSSKVLHTLLQHKHLIQLLSLFTQRACSMAQVNMAFCCKI